MRKCICVIVLVAKVTSHLFLWAFKRVIFNYFPFHLKEGDAALGNGGLARLSACQMDSLATLDYPAWGYNILYMHNLSTCQILITITLSQSYLTSSLLNLLCMLGS